MTMKKTSLALPVILLIGILLFVLSGCSSSHSNEADHSGPKRDSTPKVLSPSAPGKKVYKNNSAKIKLASEGDTINIDTFYSSYEYTIKNIYTAHNKHELKNAGAGLSRALVLYTDSSVGAGISNAY